MNAELDRADCQNRPIWLTLWGCLTQLPAEHVAQATGLDTERVRVLQLMAHEYLNAHRRAIMASLELPRAKTIGGPWLPPEEE